MSGADDHTADERPGGTTRVPISSDRAATRVPSSDMESATLSNGGPGWDGDATLGDPPALGVDRYLGLVHAARGGQGDVFEAFDQRLSRRVALKVLRPDRPFAADALRHEVGLMVGLEHPGIVPVYDQGETTDGRPWFAMQWLAGENFGAVIARMRAGDAESTPRRVLDLLARVAAATGYAHRQGVGHFDLKPSNVIVGVAGAARVVDWGLARRIPRPAVSDGSDRQRSTAGTPGYMAPERLAGEAQDARVDVYALGAMLYRVLTGRTPGMVIAPPKRWRARWPDGEPVADDLIALAAAAVAHDPARRPADGAAFARALTDWLDGARRRDEARAQVAQAETLRQRWRTLQTEVTSLRRQARRALDAVGPLASAEAKRPGRALEDAAEAGAAKADLVESRLIGLAQSALNRAPDLAAARAILAEHHRDVLVAAEVARDVAGARRAAAMVREHGDAAQIEWLDGPGLVSLSVGRPDVRVSLARYAEHDRRRIARPWRVFEGPLEAEPVPPGSYLAILEAPGRVPTRCPIDVSRGEHWRNAPPGGASRPVTLLRAAVADALFVPAGWCVVGGDPSALDGLSRRRVWVDDFVIERTSVTHRAWRDFVADVAAREGPETAVALLPRHRDTASGWSRPLILGADGAVVFGAGEDGEPLDPETPVALVDYGAATRYAEWKAARTGLPWRLPHDLEWEKAARGVDGRIWPWGDVFDPTYTRVAESFAGRPLPGPVGACPADESPYGVRDMAGLVRNWCATDYHREGTPGEHLRIEPPSGPLRMVRGGAWVAAARTCHPAGRFANRPDQRFRTIGVRLACSWDGADR